MKALIFENKVIEVREVEFEVHSDMQWMECPADCLAGWVLNNGVVELATPAADTRPYNEKRKDEYPYFGDQLDDLFRSGVFSTEMTSKIQTVKDKYPKE
jgi:hypothetical protein